MINSALKKIVLALIKKIANSRTRFSRSIRKISDFYSSYYDNANHDPDENGEYWLMSQLCSEFVFDIIDCGAYVGEYSHNFLNLSPPESKAVLFEPNKSNIHRIKENLRSFPSDRYTIFNYAASSKNGTIDFFVNDGHANGCTTSEKFVKLGDYRSQFYQQTVESRSIDSLINDNSFTIDSIALLKIDVEGHEFNVLNGCQNLLKTIGIVQFEYGIHSLFEGFRLLDFYESFGEDFYIARLMPDYILISRTYKPHWDDFRGRNLLLINKRDSAHPMAKYVLSIAKYID